MKFHIVREEGGNVYYLYGYDGVQWEWIANRKQAWHLDERDAKKKLERIKQQTPQARMVTV